MLLKLRSNIVAMLRIMWFSTLVKFCVNIGIMVGPQHSHSIQAMLPQHFGNGENYIIFQLCHNALTMLAQCWSLVKFQHWPITFPHHSHNATWALCEGCDITLFSMLYQCCHNVIKLCKFSTLWKHWYNVMLMLWQHCGNNVI